MGKMFGNFTTDGLEAVGDRLGGGGLVDSGAYTARIKAAYVSKATSSNAQSVTVLLDINGQELRAVEWVSNKDGQNFYADKQDPSKKRQLPGFNTINELCLVTTGEGLADQDVQDKVLEIYNFDEKKAIPTNVPVLVDLTGKEVTACVIRQIVDKQKKDAAGNYVNTGETREENVVDKFIHLESGMTVSEAMEGLQEGVFLTKWLERNKDKTRNRAKGAAGAAGAPGRPGSAPPAAGGAAAAGGMKPRASLFGKK